MMIQVCIERDAVAIEQLVSLAVAVKDDRAALDERSLPTPGLMPRGITRAPGDRTGRQRVSRELGALAGQRRGEDLIAVARHDGRSRAAFAGAHDGYRAVLIEAQKL